MTNEKFKDEFRSQISEDQLLIEYGGTCQGPEADKPSTITPEAEGSMDIPQTFDMIARDVHSGKVSLTSDQSNELYGLYKQATIGDNTTPQPWAIQLDARAKWDSW